MLWALGEATLAGVDAVHVRDPGAGARDLYEFASRCRDAIADRAMLVVNDRIDVAIAIGAAAVQLGRRSLATADARRVSPALRFGRSVHSVDEAAAAGDCDWLLVGTIYESASHLDRLAAGPSLIADIGRQTRIPIVAIGGITIANAPAVLGAGAFGIAVIAAILSSDAPGAAASAFRRVIEPS